MLNQKRLILGYQNITLTQIKRILEDLIQYSGNKFSMGVKRHVLKNVLHKKVNPINAHRLFKLIEKLGYVKESNKVVLTPVAYDWLNNSKYHYDTLENALPYYTYGQAILLRQLLKIRAVKGNSNKDVRPFLIALHLLSYYKTMSLTDFNYILEELGSSIVTCNNVDGMIKDYQNVLDDKHPKQTFYDFKNNYFVSNQTNLVTFFVKALYLCKHNLSYQQLSNREQKIFKVGFQVNKTSAPRAFKFIRDLYEYSQTTSKAKDSIILDLLKLSHTNTIENAFGNQRVIFSSKKKNKVSDFKRKYKGCKLLLDDGLYLYHFCRNAREQNAIKQNASITDNTLKLTNLITIRHGLIHLKNANLWKGLFKISKVHEKVNHHLASNLDVRLPLHSILNIQSVQATINVINQSKQANLTQQAKKQSALKRFKNFINSNYTHEKLIEGLQLCLAHYRLAKNSKDTYKIDTKLQKLISNHDPYANTGASVPSIFEYLTGITWYFLTNKTSNPLSAYNMNLTDFYPDVHAQGGMPDLDFYNAKKHLHVVFEVTLMTPHAQKRHEIVPDVLHTIKVENKALKHDKQAKTITFYIAGESDRFTQMQFLAQRNIPELSNGKGLNIVPLTINNLINFLKANYNNPKRFNADYLLNRVSNLRKELVIKLTTPV